VALVLRYGNGYWGVTEANYLLVVINWVTAAVGPWLWASKVRDILHVTPPSWLPQRIAEATVNETIIAFVSFWCPCSNSLLLLHIMPAALRLVRHTTMCICMSSNR
jgi:hypothetical protein